MQQERDGGVRWSAWLDLMGDMADYTLESIEWCIYNGCDEGDGWEQPVSDKTCRCCGRTGLQWGKRDGKWRLFDNRGIHACKVNPLRSNEKGQP